MRVTEVRPETHLGSIPENCACALEPVPCIAVCDSGAGFFVWLFSRIGGAKNEVKGLLEKQENKDTKANQRRFLCPACGKHTVLWLLPTTQITDLPIKCKRCGKESIVSITPEPVP